MQPFKIMRIPFPGSVRGLTSQQNGYCLIVLNSRATMEEQAACLLHELGHIALDHFDSTRPIKEIEAEANQFAKNVTTEELAALMEWEMDEGSEELCGS